MRVLSLLLAIAMPLISTAVNMDHTKSATSLTAQNPERDSALLETKIIQLKIGSKRVRDLMADMASIEPDCDFVVYGGAIRDLLREDAPKDLEFTHTCHLCTMLNLPNFVYKINNMGYNEIFEQENPYIYECQNDINMVINRNNVQDSFRVTVKDRKTNQIVKKGADERAPELKNVPFKDLTRHLRPFKHIGGQLHLEGKNVPKAAEIDFRCNLMYFKLNRQRSESIRIVGANLADAIEDAKHKRLVLTRSVEDWSKTPTSGEQKKLQDLNCYMLSRLFKFKARGYTAAKSAEILAAMWLCLTQQGDIVMHHVPEDKKKPAFTAALTALYNNA